MNTIVNLSGNSRSLYCLTDTLLGRQKINNYPNILLKYYVINL